MSRKYKFGEKEGAYFVGIPKQQANRILVIDSFWTKLNYIPNNSIETGFVT